ncbi:MAG: hypothetical protein ACI4B3_06540 [Prevotella sp.]
MDKIKKISNMMEHPELYGEDDFRQALLDDDSRLTFKTIADLEAALDAENESLQLTDSDDTTRHNATTPLWHKIAAAVVGICLLSGVAYAAVVSGVFSSSPKQETVATADSVATVGKTQYVEVKDNGKTLDVKKVFENATLEQVLHDIGYVNGKAVAFRTDSVRLLRLYYEWDSRRGLDKNVEELNRFEKINITIKGDSLIVE